MRLRRFFWNDVFWSVIVIILVLLFIIVIYCSCQFVSVIIIIILIIVLKIIDNISVVIVIIVIIFDDVKRVLHALRDYNWIKSSRSYCHVYMFAYNMAHT